MKAFVKYCLLLIIAVIYLGQRVDTTRYMGNVVGQERLVSNDKEAFERLAMLTAENGNALPANSLQEASTTNPSCRYLPRNNYSVQFEEYKRVFTPYFKYIENEYLDSFALRQDNGYYVFALREIIV